MNFYVCRVHLVPDVVENSYIKFTKKEKKTEKKREESER